MSSIVTLNPKDSATSPCLRTLLMPVPYRSPSFGTSISGIKHNVDAYFFNIFSCAFVHAEPSGATVFSTPKLWSRKASGAPSTI